MAFLLRNLSGFFDCSGFGREMPRKKREKTDRKTKSPAGAPSALDAPCLWKYNDKKHKRSVEAEMEQERIMDRVAYEA